MLVLDTNVLSEVLRPEPDAGVQAWLRSLVPASVFTTAITQAEVMYGIAIMPKGHRRSTLLTAATLMFEDDFQGRILPFNSDAAVVFRRRDKASGETRFIYHGNDGTSFPWNDTAQLDYLNAAVRE